MTRKQMEAKIEALEAEIRRLNDTHGKCCHGGCTCIHWHYTTYPNTSIGTFPYQYQVYSAGGNYQITSS
jgi:hypothetical protein